MRERTGSINSRLYNQRDIVQLVPGKYLTISWRVKLLSTVSSTTNYTVKSVLSGCESSVGATATATVNPLPAQLL